MKKIIVAIDFSKNSFHALEYAINLANQIKSEIIMIWVDKFDVSENVFSKGNIFRDEAIKNFSAIIKKYKNSLKYGTLDYKLKRGKIYHEIASFAKSENAFLLITGAHGVSGFEQYWIGSNANRIITYSPCPVITLRNDFKFNDKIKKIVLPIDSTKETSLKFKATSEFAEYFDSEIFIYKLYSTKLKSVHKRVDNYANQAKVLFDKNGIKYFEDDVITDNITKSVLNYSEEINADLISIVTEQKRTATNILLGQFAQQIVNNSKIPIMTINND
ncbi:MAG: universal stress protein [Bacteroidales bacterium]|nr:universal stress protein [Bacteroidales bacterium]